VPVVNRKIIDTILDAYVLPPIGIHGLPHWGRVLEFARRIAQTTGANDKVLELFSVFHDACRVNEQIDPGHGNRGAALAKSLRSPYIDLTDHEFDLLIYACERHTDGLTEADVTVQTCWDADRLDLWRVGIDPWPDLLCTGAARDNSTMDWCRRLSLSGYIPDWLPNEWLG
jgi:uncharacterized protein